MPKLLLKALLFLLVINGLLVSLVSRPMDEETLQAYVTLIRASGNPEYTPQQPFYPELKRLHSMDSFLLCCASPKLKTLPPEIGQLSGLEFLDLSRIPLTTLPSEIGQLFNLQILHLNYTFLITLPSEVGQLANLQTLNLSNTFLISLPPEIDQLGGLQTLNLSNTSLTSLPPEIGQLSRLQTIDLRGTPLWLRLTELEIELGLPSGFFAERHP